MLNKKELSLYYETNNIEVKKIDTNKLELVVREPGIIQRQQKENDGLRWKNFEAYSSIGALTLFSQINDGITDTIIVEIVNKSQNEKYQYSTEVLKNIDKYKHTCLQLMQFLRDRKIDEAKKYLDFILLSNGDAKVDKFLNVLFLKKRLGDASLIGFNTHTEFASLYFNVNLDQNLVQTYIFSFILGGDGKIASITIPKYFEHPNAMTF